MKTDPAAANKEVGGGLFGEQDQKLWAIIEDTEAKAREEAQNDNILEAIRLREKNFSRLHQDEKFRDRPETQQTRVSLANDCRVYGDILLSLKEDGYLDNASDFYFSAFSYIGQGRSADHPDVIEARDNYAEDLKRVADFAFAAELLKTNLNFRIVQCGENHVRTQNARFALAEVNERLAENEFQHRDLAAGRRHAETALKLLQIVLLYRQESALEFKDPGVLDARKHLAYVLFLLDRYDEARGHFQTCLHFSQSLQQQGVLKAYIAACNPKSRSSDVTSNTSRKQIVEPTAPTNVYQDESPGSSRLQKEQKTYKGRTLSADATSDPTRWVEGLRRSHKLLGIRNGRVRTKYDHVKIAILDTGIDGSLQHVNCSENIIEWKSWVPEDAQEAIILQGNRELIERVCIDRDGHGTHLAAVIMDVSPLARLYVARVAREWNDIEADRVAEAIEYAFKTWKVDIISMSLGFQGRRKQIVETIAQVQNVLMFAAGSNDGLNNRVAMYPASDSKVIRVNSADYRGAPSDDNALPVGIQDYTTLGVNVASLSTSKASLDHGREVKTLSGCSVATAVLAATASLFLEFVRQEAQRYKAAGDSEEEKKMHVAEFWMKENMIKNIFDAISSPNPSFRFIQPWALLDGGDDMQHTALNGRQKAVNTILSVLDAQGCDF